MISELVPATVVTVEAYGDDPAETVFPGEEDLIARAVESRKREFITARRCAREALAKLGHPPAPIRPGERNAPQWPAGIAGSITHCAGYRAAAVTPVTATASVGIDAEPAGPLPDGIEEAVTLAPERAMLAVLASSHPGTHWDRLLFSAKESVYKAWFPLTRRWLGFEDAHLTFDPAAGTFSAKILIDGTRLDGRAPLTVLNGRFRTANGLVVTAVTVAPG